MVETGNAQQRDSTSWHQGISDQEMSKQPDLQVGDVQEVEAANELEFR